MPEPELPSTPDGGDHHRRIRELVGRALDEDGYVLGLAGALEAVAEHARLRAIDEDGFVAMAREAFHAVLREGAPSDEHAIELPP
jgi:hypothetical protein